MRGRWLGWTAVGSLALAAGALADGPEPARYVEEGEASWYGEGLHGRPTASGAPFDQNALTAAHPELPFGAEVEVTNLENGETVRVQVNDRGPHADGRVIDLSKAAAEKLDMIETGTALVRIKTGGSTPEPE